MARGLPAVWSFIVSLPFIGGGIYLYVFQTQYPQLLGVPLIVLGVFVLLIGLYIHFVAAPPPPEMQSGEEIVETREPSQRVALVKLVISGPLFGIAAYLYFFTFTPYVYPTVAFFLGLYFFTSGIVTYWVNSLTTYYLTNQRVMRVYRFLALSRKEIPLYRIRAAEQGKSPLEALAGLGNVSIASGGGGGSVVLSIKNIPHTATFADGIRSRMITECPECGERMEVRHMEDHMEKHGMEPDVESVGT